MNEQLAREAAAIPDSDVQYVKQSLIVGDCNDETIRACMAYARQTDPKRRLLLKNLEESRVHYCKLMDLSRDTTDKVDR